MERMMTTSSIEETELDNLSRFQILDLNYFLLVTASLIRNIFSFYLQITERQKIKELQNWEGYQRLPASIPFPYCNGVSPQVHYLLTLLWSCQQSSPIPSPFVRSLRSFPFFSLLSLQSPYVFISQCLGSSQSLLLFLPPVLQLLLGKLPDYISKNDVVIMTHSCQNIFNGFAVVKG